MREVVQDSAGGLPHVMRRRVRSAWGGRDKPGARAGDSAERRFQRQNDRRRPGDRYEELKKNQAPVEGARGQGV